MPIPVQCPCGARLKARDDLAGKAVPCPRCQRQVPIPEQPGKKSEEIDLDDSLFSRPINDLLDDADFSPPPAQQPSYTPPPMSAPTPVETPEPEEPAQPTSDGFLSHFDPQTKLVLMVGGGGSVGICATLCAASILAAMIPPIGETFGLVLMVLIIGLLVVSAIGSLICAGMAMLEMWGDGHEMVVLFLAVACMCGVGLPAAYICGWVYGCNQKLMAIWTVLIIPIALLSIVGMCLNALLPEPTPEL